MFKKIVSFTKYAKIYFVGHVRVFVATLMNARIDDELSLIDCHLG